MKKHVVLVGGGHAHLFVVSRAEEFRGAGAALSLIDPGMLWYSGMATGMLGGIYSPEQDRIDLQALCRKHGVEFHQTKAVSLDKDRREVTTEAGETLPYDVLSLDIGSAVNTDAIDDPDGAAWTVKPIPTLLDLQAALRRHIEAGDACGFAVVGGGPTGVEIAANIEGFCKRNGGRSAVTLFHRGDRLLPSFPESASHTLSRLLSERGIDAQHGTAITGLRRADGGVVVKTSDNRELHFDEVVLATGLVASSALAALGFAEGGLPVGKTLAAHDEANIFGAGDCISFTPRELPKVGVFGVREAPILKDNLLAALSGKPLKEYEPQTKFLIIINMGDGTGVAIRGGRHAHGRLAFLLKNFIDTRFMKKYQEM